MGLVLSLIMLVCGYWLLISLVTRSLSDRNSKILAAAILLVIYGGMSAVLLMLMEMLGILQNGALVLTVGLGFLSLVCLGVFYRQYREKLRKPFVMLLVLYFAAIVFVCLLSRIGQVKTDINENALLTLEKARASGSLAPFSHFFLNMLLFVPVGVLILFSCPDYITHLMQVLVPAMLLSAGIECLQLIFHLGTCDLEDIISNLIGALLGFFLAKAFFRLEN